MEALVYLTRTNTEDSIENARAALAAARKLQLNPLANDVKQLVVIGYLVDLVCHLYRNEVEQALQLKSKLVASIDNISEQDLCVPKGLFLIPLVPQSANMLPPLQTSGGVIYAGKGDACYLRMRWLPRDAIYLLGCLVCAAANMHKNPQDSTAETYLKAAIGE